MGGSAFRSKLAQQAFSRLPTPVYQALKERYLPRLSQLYNYVAVPHETPEKATHGDLDILVAEPKSTVLCHAEFATTSNDSESTEAAKLKYISHETLKDVLGARHVIECSANRTSNYAVPVALGEWDAFRHGEDERHARKQAPDGEIYYQVDIHPCEDVGEFNRIKFFHAYGDMGMILGVLARNIGFYLGQNGLRIADPPHPHFELTTDFDEVLSVLGLSKERFEQGFKTKVEVFEWAATMKGFDPRFFKHSGVGFTKVKPQRTMYTEFVHWVGARQFEAPTASHTEDNGNRDHEKWAEKLREEALARFGKTTEWNALIASRVHKERCRKVFSSEKVREWLGDDKESWRDLGQTMKVVMDRLGDVEGVLAYQEQNGEEGLRDLVRQVLKEVRDRRLAKQQTVLESERP